MPRLTISTELAPPMRMVVSRFRRFLFSGSIGFKPWDDLLSRSAASACAPGIRCVDGLSLTIYRHRARSWRHYSNSVYAEVIGGCINRGVRAHKTRSRQGVDQGSEAMPTEKSQSVEKDGPNSVPISLKGE